MTPSPARRWLRRTAALLVGAPLFAGLRVRHGRSGGAGGRGRAPAQSVQVVPRLDDPQGPRQERHADHLRHGDQQGQAGGHRRPCGAAGGAEAAPDAARSTRRPHAADYARAPTRAELGDGSTDKFARLDAGISQDFSLSVPVSKLGLGEDGVYQLGVSLSGQTASQPVRPGARHPADLPAVAAGRHRGQEEPAHVPVAADLLGPPHRPDGLRRPADAGLRRRLPGARRSAPAAGWSRWSRSASSCP